MAISANNKKAAPIEKQKLTKDDDLVVSTTTEKTVEKRRRRGGRKRRIVTPEKCMLCEAGVNVDYKDIYRLKRFTSRRGRMIPRSRSGLCSRHQRQVSVSIKRARQMALLPYVSKE